MRHLLIVSAAVLLYGTVMSAAEDRPLSGDHIATAKGDMVIHPVNHASLVMQWDGKTVYIDPVGGKRVYVAGDTEDTPEMRALKDIDIAFLPMNLPYTMSVEKAADAKKSIVADLYVDMEAGDPGNVIIPGLLDKMTHGTGGTWSLKSGRYGVPQEPLKEFTVSSHEVRLPAPVVVGGIT